MKLFFQVGAQLRQYRFDAGCLFEGDDKVRRDDPIPSSDGYLVFLKVGLEGICLVDY